VKPDEANNRTYSIAATAARAVAATAGTAVTRAGSAADATADACVGDLMMAEAHLPAGMYFRGVGTATPPARYTKAECLDAFQKSEWFARLDARAHFVARAVLQRDNGIETRCLAVDSLDEVFQIDPKTLAKRFLAHAPTLAASAGERALAQSGLNAGDIDAVVVSTCTGYLCPGLSGYVVELLGLRADVQAFDLVGQGCAAALPNLQLSQALLTGSTCVHVLSICVEVSSAAMYLDNDPGVLISACLFGDGAGAAVVSRQPKPVGRRVTWIDSTSWINPAERPALMFEQRDGMLRNILSRAVPGLAADYAHQVLKTVLGRAGLVTADVSAWIMHAGGRDVLLALERELGLGPQDLRFSAAMLRAYGNLSSAFVYFVLEAALADDAPDGWWWLSSFGAGFSCHGALLKVSA
jgi:alkylresorcinol/alkylpyrone synthase